jgi:hypothetical protein
MRLCDEFELISKELSFLAAVLLAFIEVRQLKNGTIHTESCKEWR